MLFTARSVLPTDTSHLGLSGAMGYTSRKKMLGNGKKCPTVEEIWNMIEG